MYAYQVQPFRRFVNNFLCIAIPFEVVAECDPQYFVCLHFLKGSVVNLQQRHLGVYSKKGNKHFLTLLRVQIHRILGVGRERPRTSENQAMYATDVKINTEIQEKRYFFYKCGEGRG